MTTLSSRWKALAAILTLPLAGLGASAQTPNSGEEAAQGPGQEVTVDLSACALALDTSGSMRGFYSGGIDTIVGLVNALEARCGETYTVATSTNRTVGGRLSSERPGTDDTLLNNAISTWLSDSNRKRLVLVTDNVADGGEGAGQGKARAQEEFYRILKEDPTLTHLSMLILRLPFEGLVYARGNAVKNRYNDPAGRALSIYVLERDGPIKDGNDAFLKEVEDIIQSQGFNKYRGAGEPDAQDYAVARLSPFDPGIKTEDESGWQLIVEDDSRNVEINSDGEIEVGRGASNLDTPFSIERININSGPDWDLGGAPFSVRYVFPEDEKLGAAISGDCEVDPPNADPVAGQSVDLTVSCVIPPIWDSLSDEEQSALAREGVSVREGWLEIAVDARNTQITLKGPLQAHYGINVDISTMQGGLASSSPDVQSRVFRLPELLDNMISLEDRRVIIREIPLKVELTHSGLALLGEWLVPIILALISLGLLALLIWFLMKPAKYRAHTSEGSESFTLSIGQQKQLVAQNGNRVRLSRWGLILIGKVGSKTSVLWRSGGEVKDTKGKRVLRITLEKEQGSKSSSRSRKPGGRSNRRSTSRR